MRHLTVKLLALAGCLFITVAPAWAQQFDWGGTLDSATNLRADPDRDEAEFEQGLRSALWAELFAEFREERRLRITGEGSYRFTYDQQGNTDPEHVLNLDMLRLRSRFPLLFGPGTAFELTAGRFGFADPTGYIWNHPGDGLQVDLRFLRWRLRLAGAYTGLLLNSVSDIRMTDTDILEEDDTDETFGPRRAIASAQLEFPELIGRQTASLFSVLQFDLRDAATDESTLNTQYFGANAEGPIEPVRGLYYNLFGVLGVGTLDPAGADEADITSGVYGGALRLFRREWRYSRIAAEWVHASGGDALDVFVPINAPATGFAFSPPLQDLMRPSLSYSLRPFADSPDAVAASFRSQLAARGYFRSTTEEDAAFDAQNGARYAGAETELELVLRPTADLGLAFTNAVFFPNDDLFDDGDPWYRGRFELSVAF